MSSPGTQTTSSSRRLPADAHIGTVRLRVADLERALVFYRGHLGLQVARDLGNTITLTPAGDAGELFILEERPGLARRPMRPRTAGLYHVALLVPDRASLGRSLLALSESGYPLRGMSDHAVSESLYLDDPDGNGLEIYADRPRELWPISGGVVQMTVEPMDVEGVVAAAEGAPAWTGLPRGTVVGHVHLTVSSMEPAIGFYRDVIGFDVMMRIPSLTAVSAGGYHHHLNLNTWAGEGAARDAPATAGLESWELRVPDENFRRELLVRLNTAGALEQTGSTILGRDPDGNAVAIARASALP